MGSSESRFPAFSQRCKRESETLSHLGINTIPGWESEPVPALGAGLGVPRTEQICPFCCLQLLWHHPASVPGLAHGELTTCLPSFWSHFIPLCLLPFTLSQLVTVTHWQELKVSFCLCDLTLPSPKTPGSSSSGFLGQLSKSGGG